MAGVEVKGNKEAEMRGYAIICVKLSGSGFSLGGCGGRQGWEAKQRERVSKSKTGERERD